MASRRPGRLRARSDRVRHRPPTALILFPALVAAALALVVVGLLAPAQATPSVAARTARDALARGVTVLTGGRLALDGPELAVPAVLLLLLLRRARLDWLALRPGPVEVRPLEDATAPPAEVDLTRRRATAPGEGGRPSDPEGREAWLRRLGVEFREHLAGARLYQTTTVPGDVETERIIEVFKGAQPSGRMAALAAIWTYLWPHRAFIVTATLRTRAEFPGHGVSVTVRRLPAPAVELEPVWAAGFEPALQRAAYAVTASILPRTRACRFPPWTQWRGSPTPMPTDLMQHYQQAKRMVAERRYDEALSLYHLALLHDADNLSLRYDLCQIFERLQLYPDALVQYAELVERLFPVTRPPPGLRRGVRLSPHPLDDPFRVRYRYVAALSIASRQARELLEPDWPELREWLDLPTAGSGALDPVTAARRPWRAPELLDLRRRLAAHFDPRWRPALAEVAVLGGDGGGLARALCADRAAGDGAGFAVPDDARWQRLTPAAARRRAVQQYLLLVAQAEAAALERDFRRYYRAPWHRPPRSASLTPVVPALMHRFVGYSLDLFEHELDHPPASERADGGGTGVPWRPDPARMASDLAAAGYRRESGCWLEHYVAACFHALPLADDPAELPEHAPYAEAAVAALDRAQRCGDEFGFVTTKRYWLLIGDPDLTGLRQYASFRAFESRVYLHPQPATRQTARYEMFHYLRRGLERGARQLERVWTARAEQVGDRQPTPQLVEDWFREERRAWEICVRLGRYHRQWQTRSIALDGLHSLVRTYAGRTVPVPYPELLHDYVRVGIGRQDAVQEHLRGMERLFDHLAWQLGPAAALGDADRPAAETASARVLDDTRAWIWFAEHASRGQARLPEQEELVRVCRARAALWAALRQWAITPARRHPPAFEAATSRLRPPPGLGQQAPAGRPDRGP